MLRGMLIAAASTAILVGAPVLGADRSRPIVDVRIDAPFTTVPKGFGDEWAPTWGADDRLYTGNDDGTSFGAPDLRVIAFGRLEGDSPESLRGTTVSTMDDYLEKPSPGPKGAAWKPLETVVDGSRRFRLAPCSSPRSPTCLFSRSLSGSGWTSLGQLFPAGAGNFSFAERSTAMESLEANNEFRPLDHYVYAAAYSDTVDGIDRYKLARIKRELLARARASDWTFQRGWNFIPGINKAEPAPNFLTFIGTDDANWKLMNASSIDGVIYMFIARCYYPAVAKDAFGRHVFRDASLIKSSDSGKTWTRDPQTDRSSPMFPGLEFGAPYIVWYGKDGAASVDGADRYVYAVSTNGHFDGGDRMVLGRVRRELIGRLDAHDWQFWRGGNGLDDRAWSRHLADAQAILERPHSLGMGGVTYIPSLGRYLLSGWNYSDGSFNRALANHNLTTHLDFYEAPAPWGPWTLVRSIPTGDLGWYAPVVGQKFQVPSADGRSVEAQLYAAGLRVATKPLTIDFTNYRMNMLKLTISTVPIPGGNPNFAGAKPVEAKNP